MTTHRIPLLTAVVGLVALVGCSDAPDDGARVATLDGSAPASVTGSSAPISAPTDPDEAMAAFDECMADHGVELPTPENRSEQVISLDDLGVTESELQDAMQACQPLLEAAVGDLTLDPAQQAEMDAAVARFDECMADAGYELPTPDDDPGEVEVRDPEDDPGFEQALSECSGTLGSLPMVASDGGNS